MNTTSWQEIKDMFDMKTKYQADKKEKDDFLNILKEKLK